MARRLDAELYVFHVRSRIRSEGIDNALAANLRSPKLGAKVVRRKGRQRLPDSVVAEFRCAPKHPRTDFRSPPRWHDWRKYFLSAVSPASLRESPAV